MRCIRTCAADYLGSLNNLVRLFGVRKKYFDMGNPVMKVKEYPWGCHSSYVYLAMALCSITSCEKIHVPCMTKKCLSIFPLRISCVTKYPCTKFKYMYSKEAFLSRDSNKQQYVHSFFAYLYHKRRMRNSFENASMCF